MTYNQGMDSLNSKLPDEEIKNNDKSDNSTETSNEQKTVNEQINQELSSDSLVEENQDKVLGILDTNKIDRNSFLSTLKGKLTAFAIATTLLRGGDRAVYYAINSGNNGPESNKENSGLIINPEDNNNDTKNAQTVSLTESNEFNTDPKKISDAYLWAFYNAFLHNEISKQYIGSEESEEYAKHLRGYYQKQLEDTYKAFSSEEYSDLMREAINEAYKAAKESATNENGKITVTVPKGMDLPEGQKSFQVDTSMTYDELMNEINTTVDKLLGAREVTTENEEPLADNTSTIIEATTITSESKFSGMSESQLKAEQSRILKETKKAANEAAKEYAVAMQEYRLGKLPEDMLNAHAQRFDALSEFASGHRLDAVEEERALLLPVLMEVEAPAMTPEQQKELKEFQEMKKHLDQLIKDNIQLEKDIELIKGDINAISQN